MAKGLDTNILDVYIHAWQLRLAVTLAFMKTLWHTWNENIGSLSQEQVLINLTNPPSKETEFHSENCYRRREIHGRFAKGWQKASLPGSHPGQKLSSLSCNVETSTPSKSFQLVLSFGQSVK